VGASDEFAPAAAAKTPHDRTAVRNNLIAVSNVAHRLGKGFLEMMRFLISIRAPNQFVVWVEVSLQATKFFFQGTKATAAHETPDVVGALRRAS
jgi:hypothetical protein